MAEEIYMDLPAVRDMAKKFDAFSEILEMVSKVLEGLMFILKTTAFIGLVGGYAVLKFIESIKPQIDKMAAKCAELSQDLKISADAYEEGDMDGANLFATKYG